MVSDFDFRSSLFVFPLQQGLEPLFLECGPSEIPAESLGYFPRPLDLEFQRLEYNLNEMEIILHLFPPLTTYPVFHSPFPIYDVSVPLSKLRNTEYLTFPFPIFYGLCATIWPLAFEPFLRASFPPCRFSCHQRSSSLRILLGTTSEHFPLTFSPKMTLPSPHLPSTACIFL